MIPVTPQPEPPEFNEKVRQKGKKFLAGTPNPTAHQFKGHSYWQRECLDWLYSAYAGVCAYSAQWIPQGEGTPTADHYKPKSAHPHLAYEWSNYRLASLRCNSLKKDYEDVLDPFEIEPNWFHLKFPILIVTPNATLGANHTQKIQQTIDRLKFNENKIINSRKEWLKQYCKGFPFKEWRRKVPFMAYELERQNLVDAIREMMPFQEGA
jgi:hypothetical protein